MSGKVRFALPLIVVALSPAASAAPFLYATRPTTGEVVAIDLADGSLAGSLAAGALPSGAAIDAAGSRLVVADAAGDEARSFLLPGGGAVLATGDGPAGVTITPDGATVAIANAVADTVALFAASSGASLATLPVGDAPLAVATDGVRLAVTNYGSASVSLVDLGSQAVTAVGVGDFPAGVAIAAGRAWVANFADDTVSVVDLSTSTVVATVPVGSAPRGIVAGGGRVYVGNLNDGTVSVLDVVTATVLATWTLPTGSPTDLLLSPAGDRLFAAHPAATQLSVLDATTGAAQPSLAVPGGLTAFAGITGVGPGGVPGIPALSQLGLLALGLLLAALAVRRLRGLFAVGLLTFAAAVAGSAARAQDVVFSDDDFAATSWAIEQASVGNGSHQAFQSGSIGNPAPSRVMEAMSPPPSSGPEVVEVVHRFTDGTYDPATQGAISTIDASWQRLVVANDGYDDLAESFVVVQGGTVFTTAAASFSASSWQGVSRLGLGPLDFDDGSGGNPVFGVSGSPLSFGYLRRATHSSVGEAFAQHAIDGFVVTVHGGNGPPDPGVLSFSQLTYAAVDEPPTISVVRTEGTEGAASVEVNLELPFGAPLVETASWADGEGGARTVTFAPLTPLGEIGRFNLTLSNPAGATLGQRIDAVLLYTSDPELAAQVQLLAILLSRLGPVVVLMLAPLACWLAWRRRHGGVAAASAARSVHS
jgi:YVTN family beta-propeller protein